MNGSAKKWHDLMHVFGLPKNTETHDKLMKAYAEKHRHYHTFAHVKACLSHLEKTKDLATHPHEVELALWFHDAIYKPFSKDNELNSANWAHDFLIQNNCEKNCALRVYRLILATLHGSMIDSNDEKLITDIDLSILGCSFEVYQQFESNVRKEYRLVPYFIYRKKRREILQNFLNQAKIYHFDYFREKLEKQARINLTRAILNLS